MDIAALTGSASAFLAAQADADRAIAMAAYMKTEMPFYGVQAPKLRVINRQLTKGFPARDSAEYDVAVRALWSEPHREEKHLAILYARRFRPFISPESLDLYRLMIVEGAWWDLVDPIATHLVGQVLLDDRGPTASLIRGWITDDVMWLRRTSIICQLRHKLATDTSLLADACLANLGDKEFFIRKAIGWALREYAKTDPEWVREFVDAHRDGMSGLSIREATKYL